ncbi:hypothetical protein EK904_010543 [Melospiza melodia maxima]|nr:hypothetical protein EK904_010543 [Melospiza melodia maxima]
MHPILKRKVNILGLETSQKIRDFLPTRVCCEAQQKACAKDFFSQHCKKIACVYHQRPLAGSDAQSSGTCCEFFSTIYWYVPHPPLGHCLADSPWESQEERKELKSSKRLPTTGKICIILEATLLGWVASHGLAETEINLADFYFETLIGDPERNNIKFLTLKYPKSKETLLNSTLEAQVTGQLTSEGAKQLKEHSEPSSTRHYTWLNQEAVEEKFAVRNFQPALLCAATAAPNKKAKMAQRASHREGAGPWEPWHDSRSAVLAATTQARMHFRNT